MHANYPEEWAEEANRVQSLFREANERILRMTTSVELDSGRAETVCACADPSCLERIGMTIAEHEAIRSRGNRFAVVPGHEIGDLEEVVAWHSGYVVVERLGLGYDRQVARTDEAAGHAARAVARQRARDANAAVYAVRHDCSGRIGFVCECGAGDCRGFVVLTPAQYRDRYEHGFVTLRSHASPLTAETPTQRNE